MLYRNNFSHLEGVDPEFAALKHAGGRLRPSTQPLVGGSFFVVKGVIPSHPKTPACSARLLQWRRSSVISAHRIGIGLFFHTFAGRTGIDLHPVALVEIRQTLNARGTRPAHLLVALQRLRPIDCIHVFETTREYRAILDGCRSALRCSSMSPFNDHDCGSCYEADMLMKYISSICLVT